MHTEFWFRQCLDARREIDSVAENRNTGFGAVLHSTHYRRTGIEADAQLRPHAVRSLQ